jgi:hypothetical protein
MALGEAKARAKREFQQALEATGLSLEDCYAYVEEHPELKRPMYKVPKREGVIGVAANMVYHIADRRKQQVA